jgi:hypothetical protein
MSKISPRTMWARDLLVGGTTALVIDQDPPVRQGQQDANFLNGAAATFTVLALFASVFAT